MRNEPAQLDPILLEILTRKVAAAAQLGRPCRAILNESRAGDTQLSKVDLLKVKAGDTANFLMPSAGGAGDLNLRAPEAV
jgi:hypothetical protein